MSIFSTRNIVLFFTVSSICAASAFYFFGPESNSHKTTGHSKETRYSSNTKGKNTFDEYELVENDALKISPSEFILGDRDAAVTFIDYASMSCPHCASFYDEAFDDLKEEYIDTGKVRFVYRDFPLNQPSLTAAAISICRAYEFDEDNRAQGYHDFVKTMYNTQNSWIFKEDYSEKLVSIAVLEGMDKDLAKKCAKDTQIYDQILQARIIAAKELEIQSTPTFFINGKRVQGFVGYKKIKELIDYELNK